MVSMNIILRLFTVLFILFSQAATANNQELSFEKEKQTLTLDQKKKIAKPVVGLSFSETGIASWYGREFSGRPTASGEIFNPDLMTAAHKYLPLNSIVKVTNLENKKSIRVIVNDKGPFIAARVIDLSRMAAEVLGFKDKGLAKVKLEYLHNETIDLSNALTSKQRKRLHREIEKFSLGKWRNVIKAHK
ncbi:septal ring lytic transglycosylase RlpA family protein [Holosporaceae bacterium 'Namur']|nr:septal ring lytic transglycosylase RlpA family protein [Holosporaceae bacterium 'Namur']